MKKIALSTLFSAMTLVAAPAAFAQNCPPGSWLCAEVQVNTGVVQQPYVVTPPPPPPQVVYVQRPPPPPQVVYVQAPPPPPQRVVVTTTPVYTVQTDTVEYVGMRNRPTFGLGAFASGLALPGRGGDGDRTGGLGGLSASARFRSHPWFATEVTLGYFAGRDYNGDTRFEVPVSLNGLVYVNPQHRFQFYLLGGLGFSAARVEYRGENAGAHSGRSNGNYGYFGGQLGVGAEWQLSPHFSIFGDVRGFLRTRVDDEMQVNPEFQRVRDGRVETTNASTGAVFSLGGMLYF